MGDMDLTLTIEGESAGAQQAVQQVASALDDLQGSMGSAASGSEQAAGALEGVGSAGDQAASGLEAAGSGADQASSGVEGAGSAAGSAIGDFGDLSSGVSELAGSLGSVAPGMSAVTSGVTGLGGAIGEIVSSGSLMELGGGIAGAAAVGIGAFAALGQAGGSFATQVMRISDITGMSTTQVDYWGHALEDVGGDMNTLATVSYMLERRLQSQVDAENAGQAGSVALANAMKAIGVAYKDADGNMRSMGDIMPELLHNLMNMTNKTEAANEATQVLGRGGKEFLVVLQEWPNLAAAVTRQTAEMDTTTEAGAKHAVEYNIAMSDMKDQLIKLETDVLPPFISMLEGIAGSAKDAADAVGGLAAQVQDLYGPLGVVKGVVQGTADVIQGDYTGALHNAKNAGLDLVPVVGATQDAMKTANSITHDLAGATQDSTDAASAAAKAWQEYTDALNAWVQAGSQAGSMPTYTGGSLSGYQHGGTVPGPYGQPRLVIAHGGEEFRGIGGQYPSDSGGGGMTNYGTIQQVFPNVRDPAGVLAEQNRLFRGV